MLFIVHPHLIPTDSEAKYCMVIFFFETMDVFKFQNETNGKCD